MKKKCCRTVYPAARRPVGAGTPQARIAIETDFAWAKGATVTYWFHDRPKHYRGAPEEMDEVRRAFAIWKKVGINIEFEEVTDRSEADLRIGFDHSQDSYSAIGLDCLNWKRGPTMNFGVSLLEDFDTALHEIGHALGFPHEHQNPKAGIVWDEEKVYKSFAGPPNRWKRKDTFENVIQKFELAAHEASSWDPNSIMHYAFEKNLIREPARYRRGLTPKGGLSRRDREMARKFYPR